MAPVPSPPTKRINPSNNVVRSNPGHVKGTPQIEKTDGHGHRTFSSSIFNRESSPEPEAEKSKSTVKKSKKNNVVVTGPPAVLAEARKQAERLRVHTMRKEAKGFKVASHKAGTDGHTLDDNQQAVRISVNAEPKSDSDEVDKDEIKESLDKSNKKRKDRSDDAPTKSPKKRKRKGSNEHVADVPIPTPESSKKSKKRGRNSNVTEDDHEDEEHNQPHKKARKGIGNAPDDTAHSKTDKKTRKKKSKNGDKTDLSAPAQEGSKHSADLDESKEILLEDLTKGGIARKGEQNNHDVPSVHPSRQPLIGLEADTKGPSNHKMSKSASTSVSTNQSLTVPANDAATDTRNPDIVNLLSTFRKLLPKSALESALEKLNCDDKDLCSQRKLQTLKKT